MTDSLFSYLLGRYTALMLSLLRINSVFSSTLFLSWRVKDHVVLMLDMVQWLSVLGG